MQTEKSWKKQYYDFIENFVKENIDFIRTLPTYEKDKSFPRDDDSISSWDYLPPHNYNYNNPEQDTIYEKKEIIDLENQFFEKFINIEGLTVDLNGHYYGIHGKTIKELLSEGNNIINKERIMQHYRHSLLNEMLQAYLDFQNGIGQKYIMGLNFVYDNALEKFFDGLHCPHCNKNIYANLYYEENKIRISDHMLKYIGATPCTYKGDKSTLKYDIKIKTPSKKIVIFNSPYSFIELERKDQYTVSICSTEGKIKESKLYEDENIGFLPVGNSSPVIFKKNNEIVIGSIYEEEHDEMLDKGYKELGYVCTDLWWYTVMDFEQFKEYTQSENFIENEGEEPEYILIDIDSDEITITHDLDATENETSNVFSVIKIK